MTARQAANLLRRAAWEMAPALQSALRDGGERAIAAAVKTSSGTVSSYELGLSVKSGGYGHPYGYGRIGSAGPRAATPYGNLAIVNAQSGDFRRRWSGGLTGWRFDVSNDDRKAAWILNGNEFTKPRPFDRPVRRTGERSIASLARRRVLALYKPFSSSLP